VKIIDLVKRNQVLKTIIVLATLFVVVQGGWYTIKLALHTEVPMAYVPSGSMEPNLKVGDLVVIQGVDAHTITTGTIIVFYVPGHYGEDNYRIVHRVIRVVQSDDQISFETKGDNNPASDYHRWQYIPAEYVVGKVIARVPYVGFVAMKMREPVGIAIIALLVVALFALEFSDGKRKRKNSDRQPRNPPVNLHMRFECVYIAAP